MTSRRIPRPTVALIGRTNVGKSTLFNRLIEDDRALVSAVAGTTRDRNYGICTWRGVPIQIVDTGGLDVGDADKLERNVVRQAEYAIEEADIILCVVDLASGTLPQDQALAKVLAKSKTPVLLVGNKADNPRLRANADEATWPKLRLGTVYPVSAKNGTGVGDLLDIILKKLGIEAPSLVEPQTKIAIIGRPNVGKSSLVNMLCKEERAIVSPLPGTTREPQDTLLTYKNRQYLLIDTVGLRRRQRSAPELEAAGVARTTKAIQRADVLFLVLDATMRVTSQDRTLAGLAETSGKAVIIVMNKWDALPKKTPHTLTHMEAGVRNDLPFFRFAPARFISAKYGTRVEQLFDDAEAVKLRWETQLTDGQLDRFFRQVIASSKAKGPGRPYIYSMKQTGAEPPTFALVTRGKEPMPEAFVRYVENRLREKFDFTGTPIRIRAKNRQVKPQ
jgi:GTP-binding protein